MRIVVVGAGIGGLTAAIALTRDGHDVTIIERARELTALGAGIGLWPNALRALSEIDLEEPVRAVSAPFTSAPVQDRHRRTLTSFPTDLVVRRFGSQPVMAHRADVQAALLEGAAQVPLRLATAASTVRHSVADATVVTDAGEELAADLVVGADGVGSVIAASLGVPAARPLSIESWRTVIDSEQQVSDAWDAIGAGHQFLATALPGGRLYLAGTINDLDGSRPAREFASVRRAYAGWGDPIPALIEEMAVGEVSGIPLRWDPVWHRTPPRRTVFGRVVLIGDAAHPMTPDLGQGGCQAIEDGVSLAAALRAGPDVTVALSRYEAVRRRRTARIVMTSYGLGELIAIRQRTLAAVRDRALALTPPSISLRQMATIAGVAAFERNLQRVMGT